MTYKVKFSFSGRCPSHPKYDPSRDGMPPMKDGKTCAGCDDLAVIALYVRIANRRAQHAAVVKKDTYYENGITPKLTTPEVAPETKTIVEQETPKPGVEDANQRSE